MGPTSLLLTGSIGLLYPLIGLAQPTIGTQPKSQSVSLGANVLFSVRASGTPPLSYEWQFNSSNIAGAVTNAVSLTNVLLSAAGEYLAVVSDGSRAAALPIDSTFTKITDGSVVSERLNSRGCAWADYNNDGWVDLLVANRDGRNESLFRNLGNGTFAQVTSDPVVSSGGDSMGGGWGDVDNDGNLDLFVLTADGGNEFYFRNQGDGTFTRVLGAAPGTPSNDGGDTVSSSWADFNGDGFLDLFTSNNAGRNGLYEGKGDGSFTKVTTGSLVTTADRHYGCAWADFDNDGDPDLFVASNGGRGILYENNAGTLEAVAVTTISLAPAASIGAAWADYDNDGFPDLFVANGGTTAGPQNNYLYRNSGNGTFAKVTTGQIVTDRESSDGCAWGDYDADGFLDLFVANVSGENNSLYHNNGDGTFTKVVTGSLVNDGGDSRGCAWGDFDNDGFLDLYVANGGNQNNFLYRNAGNANHWFTVRLIGTISNRDGIGAKVRVQATVGGRSLWQLREVSGGSGRASQNDLRAHFGLGDATIIDTLRIEWPSGIVQELRDVAPRQFLTVTEPARLQALGAGAFRAPSWKGMAFEVQTSTDLAQWSPLTTVTNLTGTLQFTDPDAATDFRRFYRTLLR